VSVDVTPRAEQVEEEGYQPKHGEEPVIKQIEAAGIEVRAVEPAVAPTTVCGGVVDHLDEEAPKPRRHAEDAEDNGTTDGLHAGGGLAVEELEQADEGGDVHDAQEEELRDQPEHGHRRGGGHRPAAAALHHGGHGERHDAEHEPDAHAL